MVHRQADSWEGQTDSLNWIEKQFSISNGRADSCKAKANSLSDQEAIFQEQAKEPIYAPKEPTLSIEQKLEFLNSCKQADSWVSDSNVTTSFVDF